jgi:hypothetical protein
MTVLVLVLAAAAHQHQHQHQRSVCVTQGCSCAARPAASIRPLQRLRPASCCKAGAAVNVKVTLSTVLPNAGWLQLIVTFPFFKMTRPFLALLPLLVALLPTSLSFSIADNLWPLPLTISEGSVTVSLDERSFSFDLSPSLPSQILSDAAHRYTRLMFAHRFDLTSAPVFSHKSYTKIQLNIFFPFFCICCSAVHRPCLCPRYQCLFGTRC